MFCEKLDFVVKKYRLLTHVNGLNRKDKVAVCLWRSFTWKHIAVLCLFHVYGALCGRVIRYRTCDREVASSNLTRGCCVPTPTQRAIPPGSVNQYQRKLGSKQAYHAMYWLRICGLAASAGVRLRATGNGHQRRSMRLGKDFFYYWLDVKSTGNSSLK